MRGPRNARNRAEVGLSETADEAHAERRGHRHVILGPPNTEVTLERVGASPSKGSRAAELEEPEQIFGWRNGRLQREAVLQLLPERVDAEAS